VDLTACYAPPSMAEKSKRLLAGMSKSGFGEGLKRERELRGVSRDEVCTATRIGSRYLEALENEQWGTLPGGVFNRGFVRAVARFLGLDEDDLLAEYDHAISEPAPHIETSVTSRVQQEPHRTRTALLVLLASLGLIVLLGTGWVGWRWHYHALRQATNDRIPVSSIVQAASQPKATPATVSVDVSKTASMPPTASASPSGIEAQGLELKIEAGKETFVTVSTDGTDAFEGSMIAGQSRTFMAQNVISISAKDAGALLLELNGQTLAPLGPPGQPGNLTLTRSNLKPTSGGSH
jgi:cytoskeleton protein RodZ